MTDQTITPIIGTSSDDVLSGSGRSEVISGRAGDDLVFGNSGSDEVHGGSGDDVLNGNTGADVLYGGGGPSFANMGDITIAEDYTGTVTFLNEGAGFRNSLGLYRVDPDGTISDVEILFENASKQGSGGNLIGGVSSVEVALEAGDRIGFFIVSNGYSRNGSDIWAGDLEMRGPDGSPANLETDATMTLWSVDPDTGEASQARSQYAHAIFHSAAAPEDDYRPNPDNFPHTVGKVDADTGTVLLGFEDLFNGGDKDYDDSLFVFDVGQSNARVLDPNLAYGDDGQETALYDAQGNLVDAKNNPLASENDDLFGGNGNDKLFGMAGHDSVSGGDGADILRGNSGDDSLGGGTGSDVLYGGKGDDTLGGSGGDDALYGDSGNDKLFGGAGVDQLTGGSGDDALDGGSGHDTLDGGSGVDSLEGGLGNDVLKGGSGSDVLYGGSGTDRLEGGKGDDSLSGGDGADRLKGGSGADALSGGDGKDYLAGGGGADALAGGDGLDFLRGGTGADLLSGGANRDKFAFRLADLDGSTDQILDLGVGGVADVIDLSDLGLLAGGLSAESWIASNALQGADFAVTLDLESGQVLVIDHAGAEADLLTIVADALIF
ncbi:MAG: DUF4114 domain-containing protein [Pseudomonadota bacterium]